MDLNPGDIIDNKYEITATLGRGGMGVVYAALHRELGGRVALKFLHPALAAKPDLASRFRHEAVVGRQITSPHVARVHDVGTHVAAPFIVMEHLTGSDLGVVLEQRGPLSVVECADLMLQVCEAMHEAHALRIVHRDLKPSNLFLTTGPDGLKVLDLGISKSPFAAEAAKTATHAVIGSPFYMSPEQLSASRSVDARTDIWSLGVILYQMLADTVPFAGSSLVDVYLEIRKGAWIRLAEHRTDVPAAIDELVSHALERDRDLRLSSMLEFATRLAPFGGTIAQESLARMRRVAVHHSDAPPSRARPSDTLRAEAENTLVDIPTIANTSSSATGAVPPARRRMRAVALGIVACAPLGGGLVLWRYSTPISTAVPPSSAAPSSSSPPAPGPSVMPAESAIAPIASPEPTLLPSASPVVVSSPPPPPPPPTRAKPACTGNATPECDAACQAHVRGACEALATALVHGRGAPRDPTRAATLFAPECKAGSMLSCNALGALYGVGDGVAQDDAKAVAFYSQACSGNFARGCLNEGAMYFDGTGVPKNERRGAERFRMACEGGEPIGCRNLGIAYRTARGVEKDEEKAREYEAKAVERKGSGGASGLP